MTASTQLKLDVFSKPAAAGLQLTVRLAELGYYTHDWHVSKHIVTVDVATIDSAKLEFGPAQETSGSDGAGGSCDFEAFVVGAGAPKSLARFRGAERDKEGFQAALGDAFETAIFEAMRQQAQIESMHSAASLPNALPAVRADRPTLDGSGSSAAMPSSPKRGWRRFLTVKRVLLASVLMVGAGFAVVGLRANQAPAPFAAANGADMDARVQAAISASLRQPSNGEGLLQGQSVNLQTMRAMGLDPGKANTGCLVGVHK